MSEASVPGVTVAIGSAEGLYWDNGFGMADLENMVPATAQTRIRLASITKPITATAVMQLVERGKMELDAPIQKYVPTFPQKQWPVTVRLLLGHLSGIRHYASDEEVASTRHYLNRVEPLKIFQDDPLKFEPGTQFSYTTYGFNLLGAAVEMVSGKPFEDYLRENIFEPAGMHSIGLDDGYAIIPHRSRGYELTADKQIRNCGLADTSNKVPGGGLISTAGACSPVPTMARSRSGTPPRLALHHEEEDEDTTTSYLAANLRLNSRSHLLVTNLWLPSLN